MAKKSPKDQIIDGALAQASVLGWQFVTLQDIAQDAGVALADVREFFDDKADILSAYGRRLDQKMLTNMGAADLTMPEKDRLFEVLMERFDLLNDDREALVSILSSFKLDPKQAVISLPHLCKSMNWVLESVEVDTNGLQGSIKIIGLTGVYIKVLNDWIKDDSEDMSKTMASLDKALDQGQALGGYLGL